MIKVETAYVINTADKLKQLFSYYAKLGYESWGNVNLTENIENIENIVMDYSDDLPCVFYFNPQNKTFETSNIDYFQHEWDGPVVYGSPSSIKTEFEREFKRMFRVNKIPLELSEEQIEKLREEKLLELWQI